MQLSQTQIQKLSQELRLTPQQILQSTILQLTTLALEAKVIQELEQNPVLEEVEPQTSDDEPAENSDNNEEEDLDWDEILPSNDDYKPKEEYDRSRNNYKTIQPSPRGLVDYLMDQVNLLTLDETERTIAHELVWNIDERGYITIPTDNIAYSLDVPIELLENVLHRIQQLDPPGIAARDLRECLLLQLESLPGSEDAILIIQKYFDDFANKRFQKIIRELGWDRDRIQAVQDTILKLNPSPGSSLTSANPNYITPDLIVEKVGDEFIIEINDSRVPDLRINSGYLQMIGRGSRIEQETKVYLKKKVDMAKWFIQSIHQRRMTMIRVMKAIIERQHDFFEGDEKALKPMILKDIAEDVKMDISTISRVTNGKYVQLSSGIHELKYFFNEGMLDENGDEVSTRIIKDKLKQIIDSEDKHKPFSDDQLSKLLKNEGYTVARRTVAKYREQLKVPVARLRREI